MIDSELIVLMSSEFSDLRVQFDQLHDEKRLIHTGSHMVMHTNLLFAQIYQLK